MPPTPPVDPDNEEFVIFVRSKKVHLERSMADGHSMAVGARSVAGLLCAALRGGGVGEQIRTSIVSRRTWQGALWGGAW